MNFNEFWQLLSAELKTRNKFQTMEQSKQFEARMSGNNAVTITPESTRKSRDVKINEFMKIWRIGKTLSRSTRYVSVNGRYSQFWSPVYVCTLIDHIVGDQDMS